MAAYNKNKRIDIRIGEKQKKYLTHVAALRHKKLSSFLLDCAFKEAEEVMASKSHFQMPEKQWKAFCDALDAPPRELPRLRKLFKEKTVFDE